MKVQLHHIPRQQQLQCFYRQRNGPLVVLVVVQRYHLEVLLLLYIGYHLVAITTSQHHHGPIHQFQLVQLIAQESIHQQVRVLLKYYFQKFPSHDSKKKREKQGRKQKHLNMFLMTRFRKIF